MKSIKVICEFLISNDEEELETIIKEIFENANNTLDNIKIQILEIFPETIHSSINIKSNFNFKVLNYGGTPVLIIEDNNSGKMSVTNNIENVLEYIKQILLYIPEYVIYMDSKNIWDQIIHDNGKFRNFYFIKAKNVLDACKKMLIDSRIKREVTNLEILHISPVQSDLSDNNEK